MTEPKLISVKAGFKMGYKICQYCKGFFDSETLEKVTPPMGEFDVHTDYWFCPKHKEKRNDDTWDRNRDFPRKALK